MMKRKNSFNFFAFLLCTICAQNSFCQLNKEAKIDSLKNKLIADSSYIYRFKAFKYLFAIDTRNSFIHNSNKKIAVDLIGGQFGFVIRERHSMGIGFYGVSHALPTNPVLNDQQKNIVLTLHIGYVTSFYEYNILETKRWEIGIPVEAGLGNYQILATDEKGKRDPTFADTVKKPFILLGSGVNIDFKVFKWVGINAMGGIRTVAGGEPNKVNLNGVFYSVGLHFYLGEVLKWNKLRKKKNVYKKEVAKIRRV